MRPAMAQASYPVTPRDSMRHNSDHTSGNRSSVIEPVSNVYEPRNRASDYYNEPVDSSNAYAYSEAARGGRVSRSPSGANTPIGSRRPMSTASTMRSGQTQYFTPQADERRWSRDQYFDSAPNQAQGQYPRQYPTQDERY